MTKEDADYKIDLLRAEIRALKRQFDYGAWKADFQRRLIEIHLLLEKIGKKLDKSAG